MSRVHYDPRPVRGPRPYDDATRADIWRWLRLRGDTRANLAVSLGEECGPRGIEVCRIQLVDIDTDEKRIWIRGTKNKINGWVSYGPKTEHWLAVWQKERPHDCGHDCLLTNSRGDPMGRSSLTDLLNAVLCKQSPSHSHEEGLEAFSFHALRHTNTSLLHKHGFSAKANRKHHRWEKDASRFVYDAMDEQQQMEQYDRAMASLDAAQEPKRATLAELIAGTNRLNKDKE
jgi:integrase